MSEVKDALDFYIPAVTPPTVYMRKGEFPNCAELFARISKNPPKPTILGRLFLKLCRITGLAWVIWLFNVIIFASALATLFYHFGWEDEHIAPKEILLGLNWKKIVSCLAGIGFVGWLFSTIARSISMQLQESCLTHLKENSGGTPAQKKPVKTTKSK